VGRKSVDWDFEFFNIPIVFVVGIEVPNDNRRLISSMIQISKKIVELPL
jgi:hypothetical protein